ncbi:nucleoside diphosphate kinase regulator [Chitinilyticum litopenaei]|uniref:nucleoside diphosphate kinase regulator n=1 Tax=Chitinilyticum litopenaei TaxID=1121276 RepID=UPI00041F7433|nr:nucleoside diphosphate kinase regulator [Chitinilyticum litopenaei]
MTTLPPITVSSLDSARLYALLERLPASAFAEAEALETELGRAAVREPQDMPPDVVTMRSTARFVMQPGGKEFELTLCYPDELDGSPGKVSITAPIGSALLGLAVGQEITWPAPGGRQVTVRLKEVTWQPEREGFLRL